MSSRDRSLGARAEDVFARVADLTEDARSAALDAECGSDAALRAEVESLLAFDLGETFVTDAIATEAATLAEAAETSWIGRRVGAWRVTGVLGRGGMGAVLEVLRDDGAFRQRAALKVIRAGVDWTLARRRFVDERQILAQLSHPNIARLVDGGETADGMPFLVMDAVDGIPITDYCETRDLSVEARLRLFATVCRAVHFAHTRLIVHRDLKPSNVLVTEEGEVKLLDFGIAKLLEQGSGETRTLVGELALTPDYASPEQVRSESVTTATDVYSLGAVLYEMLTGKKAHVFERQSLPELARVICEAPPPVPSAVAPSRVAKKLRGDVDNIVLTALRKEPSRRYPSAEQLAADIGRHLAGLPVSARADSWSYRAHKFTMRNRAAVAGAALVALSLVVGLGATLWQARRAERRFQQVRTLANAFLFRYHDAIRDLPGSTPARELLVTTALEYLDTLSADAQNDEGLQMELAAAYEKVGDVLGSPRAPSLGRTDEALVSYEKSLQLRTRASGRGIDREVEGRAILQSHIRIADALINAGRTEESVLHVARANELAERFGTAPDRVEARIRQGDLQRQRGDLRAAEESYRTAASAARAHAQRSPGLGASTTLAGAAARLGQVLKLASRQKECLQALDLALEATLALHRAEPTRTTYVYQLFTIHNDRGDALRSPFAAEGMRPDLSLKEYEAALAQAEWLAGADPSSFPAKLNVLIARAQVADTWREIDAARALPMFEALSRDAETLHREDPANFRVRWIVTTASLGYADATRRAGLLRESLPRFDEAVERAAAMMAADRGRAASRRDMASALAERGRARMMVGDVRGGQVDAAACRRLADSFEIAKARPLDLRDVALCHELGGDVALRLDDAPRAVESYRTAVAWWREFSRRGLDSPFLRERVSSAEEKLTALEARR